MRLHEFGPARSIRARWILQELGVDFESARVDLPAGEQDIPPGRGRSDDPGASSGTPHDELHLANSPVLPGSGEPLFAGLDLTRLGYRCIRSVLGIRAMQVVLAKG